MRLWEMQNWFDQVYQSMDDWIVTAVEKENEVCEQAVDFIKEAILNEEKSIDISQFRVDKVDLESDIIIIDFRDLID